MIFWIFPIVPCHAFCMWHWPIGKNLDSSFIWGHHHLIVSIWISVYQLNTSYSLLRRTDETQQGRNSCLRLQMLASVWTLSCHCPVKLLTQYQPCIIVCYSEKYQLLKDDIAKVWHMGKVIAVPVIIGAFGAASVNFKKYMKRIGVEVSLEFIQKTALLGTAQILRKVLSCNIKEERDLGPMVTCCNPLPRTINQAEYLAWVYKEWTSSSSS